MIDSDIFNKTKQFTAQPLINSVSLSNPQSQIIDSLLVDRFRELSCSANLMIEQMNSQKTHLLKRFDMWLMPMANEVINQMLNDAKQLQADLYQTTENESRSNSEGWTEQAKILTKLYSKWNNQEAIVEKVLELVFQRASLWIDKDIQIIQEYQTQSIEHLVQDSEEFNHLKERLTQAIAEPLKNLLALREPTKPHSSLKQASEWLAHFQSKRETYFDQLLMKIDHVVQDIVQVEELEDSHHFAGLEGEIAFLEQDFKNFHQLLNQMKSGQKEEKKLIQQDLNELFNHCTELYPTLPKQLQKRLLNLKQLIQSALNQ